jgi:DNA processing protein
MPADEDLAAWLRLSLVPGVDGGTLRRLIPVFGSPRAIVDAGRAALERHVRAPIAAAIAGGSYPDIVAATRHWLEDPGNQLVTIADPEFPRAVSEIADPPALLYVKGRLELLQRPSLAIVGSRNASAQGAENAESFARALSDGGLTIASGMALGIDAAAHRGGLAGSSSSVAVVGTGLDIVYPARNRALAHELAERGVLISEFPLGTPPLPANFPRRNRLISGLALGCLVVEAAVGSGSLITARGALEQGREVFAIPGSIHSPLAKGCHALIKQGAKLVESAADVLEELNLPATAATNRAPAARGGDIMSRLPRKFLDALGFDPFDPDALAARTGMSAAEVAALLTQLEIEGAIETLPGGRFRRIR